MTVLVTIWTLLAAPVLCIGGLIEHPCDCGNAVQCEHESTCLDDPCNVVGVRDEPQNAEFDFAEVLPVADEELLSGDRQRRLEPSQGTHAGLPFRRNLPYPASDVPLLI